MHSANNGVTWVSDVSAKGLCFSAARNFAVRQTFLGVDAGEQVDYIVWVDSDIVCEPQSITQLVETAVKGGHDFVSGVYHMKTEVAKPVIYDCQKKWWPRKAVFNACISYPPDTIAPIGGCGFGFCITSVKMLQKMKKSRHWEEVGQWFPDTRDLKGGYGEDLAFCKMAMQCGYQAYVNTGIQLGHMGNGKIWTQDDWKKACLASVLESRSEV
jgi:GT2 family glycosyltransferase